MSRNINDNFLLVRQPAALLRNIRSTWPSTLSLSPDWIRNELIDPCNAYNVKIIFWVPGR